jgi:hypothetical protein
LNQIRAFVARQNTRATMSNFEQLSSWHCASLMPATSRERKISCPIELSFPLQPLPFLASRVFLLTPWPSEAVEFARADSTQAVLALAASIAAALIAEAMGALAWAWASVPLPSVPRPPAQQWLLHTTTARHADITPTRRAIEARVIHLAFAITAIRTGVAKCAGVAGSPHERSFRCFATTTIRSRMAVPDVLRCLI